MITTVPNWADVLTLRNEVVGSDGSVGELQMSLHKAVFQTVDVPYRKVDYYVEITEPTPNLIGFFGRVARQLGTRAEATALFHLDQGMGGGKSHALVGLYHLVTSPDQFFASPLGQAVRVEAEHGGEAVEIRNGKVVTLTADYFSPGKTSETFGPATTLFERFLWSLVDGDMDHYQHWVSRGPNKGTLQEVLAAIGRPVLILLDELMDYVLQLSDASNLGRMSGEKAFLNALMDACDDVPHVACVVVMIRSELDERGYPLEAEEFRDYIAARLVRNGTTVAVTEAQDFSAIIRRRLFETPGTLPIAELTKSFANAADKSWQEQVFDRLGPNRGLAGLAERIESSYPFHPELMRLVQEEWSRVQGFQRVRSTVAIFARTALYWVQEQKAGHWAPPLVGVGDIPLTVALEQVLSSGLLLGNDRAIQGYRAVAGTDITTTDGNGGRAVVLQRQLVQDGVTVGQPNPALRMATALFCYSLVGRAQARRGATKAELLAALFLPLGERRSLFTQTEEVFNALTGEDGLGALEITTSPNLPTRYYLSIKQTLRMYFTAATALLTLEERDSEVWKVAQELAQKGTFDQVRLVDGGNAQLPLEKTFEGVDSTENRLVVLDPRRWTLLNGRDAASREDITAVLGLGPRALRVDNAASCVVVAVNTQQRELVRKRAGEVLAWRYVLHQLGDDTEDERVETAKKLTDTQDKLKGDIQKAYRHYAYLERAGDLHVRFERFDDDSRTSLRGDHIWAQLVKDGRATVSGGLSTDYLATLLDSFDRALTPREIIQSFYKNPAFPLLPSTDEIRRAVFELLQHDWEFVDSDGIPLTIASPGQVQINSISQTLRRRKQIAEDPAGYHPDGIAGDAGTDTDQDDSQYRSESGPIGTDQDSSQPTRYKRYRITLANRSITALDAREQVWQLLKELAKVIDPVVVDADHQLISLDMTLTTASGQQGGIEEKARQVGAHVRVEDDDF